MKSSLTDLTQTVGADEGDDSPTLAPPGPGSKIGRYAVLERIGVGAMGVVYAAYDPELDRKVALKLLLNGARDRSGRSRATHLLREARAMARLTDPNVIGVHDVGSFEDTVFVAMEFVDGQTLTRWLARDRHPWQDVLDVLIRAGRGLRAAHRAGLVHADFKPDNVMVGLDTSTPETAGQTTVTRVRVMDFGLARAKGQLVTRACDGEGADDRSRGGTEESHVGIGTPAYMSPEQHLAEEPDARSDQFSFCVALYEALYGSRPFAGQTFYELSAQVIEGRVRQPPRDSPVVARVRDAVLRGLARRPEDRFESMDGLLAELESGLKHTHRRVRPWHAFALVGGLLVIGAAVIVAGRDSDDALCSSGRARVSTVWNDAHRDSMQTAFTGVSVGFSSDTWHRVERDLDAYAEHWVQAHREACEATHVHHDQSTQLLDRRMGCLNRALSEMRALVAVFHDADDEVVQHAVRAVTTLPDLRRCADERVLLAEVAPPADRVDDVEALRNLLARAHALEESGRYHEGLALAHEAVLEADELGYVPLQAEARASLGRLQSLLGDYEHAASSLMSAYWDAVAAHSDRLAVEIAIRLVSTVGEDLLEHQRALEWAEHARAQLARMPDEPLLEARRLVALGAVRSALGEHDEARSHHEEALRIMQRELPSDDSRLASSLTNLGLVAVHQARYDEALRLHEEALRIRIATFGRVHPDIAYTYNNLGNALLASGRLDEALGRLEDALSIHRAALGADHPRAGTIHNSLGDAYMRRGQYEDAEQEFRRARDIWGKAFGSRHPKVGLSASNMAIALEAMGRYEEALEMAREGLEIARAVYGDEHPSVAVSLAKIASIVAALGRGGEVSRSSDKGG
jgi:eukaryotic-like serine/threonine-protein kinase